MFNADHLKELVNVARFLDKDLKFEISSYVYFQFQINLQY